MVSNPMFSTGVGLILLATRVDQEFEVVGLLGGRKNGNGLWRAFDRMKNWVFNFF